MKIVVCIRQGRDGEINPFDACAYEEALKIENAEITLVSMGVPSAESFLKNLTRLGAKDAILLTDKAFAGADTLATAYTLSLLMNKLKPDLVFCGRQTLEGDTAQVPTMLSQKIGYGLITNVMKIVSVNSKITCEVRNNETRTSNLPALITVERINTLRLPSLRSKMGEVKVMGAADLGADISRCGLTGSPTRVLETKENNSGKRRCEFIGLDKLMWAIEEGLKKNTSKAETFLSEKRLDKVFAVGKETLTFAKSVSDDVTVLDKENPEVLEKIILDKKPNAVLFGSDDYGKRTSALLSSKLDLGLCADCTSLDTDGNTLFMIRPALSGSVIAKIKSLTVPAMATVRTESPDIKDVFVCVGYGAKDYTDKVKDFANSINAELAATRKAVDNGIMPYKYQVGLTGKTVAPPVYVAIGVSGAVHHIVGMQKSGTVIAINNDKNSPIFEYADFGIITSDLKEL